MTCSIIAIGNELTNGEVVDSNSSFLASKLRLFGLKVVRVSLVPDDLSYIRDEVLRVIKDSNYLFITGGLGPTEDDITRYGISQALGLELVKDSDELSVMGAKYLLHDNKVVFNNDKQALFPRGARLLSNSVGIASGFYLCYSGCHIFVLPGVPSEMRGMMYNEVMPILDSQVGSIVDDRLIVKLIGKGEASIDKVISDKIVLDNSIRWEIIARVEGVFLKFYPLDSKDSSWRERLIASLDKYFASYIYAYGDDSMLDIVTNLLLDRGMTLSTIESCTGGYLSKYLTDRSGSSEYFLGGIVSYSNELKVNLVGIDPLLIDRHGVVSAEVAEAMARGGKSVISSDICLAITGIAGPTGGSEAKPVGTVWFAIIDSRDIVTVKRRLFIGDREDIRLRSVFYGLNLVRLALENKLELVSEVN